MNRGFIPDKVEDIKEDYEFLGATKLEGQILVEDGQWDNFLPVFELQKNENFDSWSCVSFAATNSVETLNKRLYGEEVNFSDRFLSVMSGTIPNRGNSIRKVVETIRKNGLVEQNVWPFTPQTTLKEFFSPVSKEVRDLGIKWLETVSYGYEWVSKIEMSVFQKNNETSREKMMEALKYSPLQTAIDASTKHTSQFKAYNDSVMIHGFEKGKGWKVFGSYPSTTGIFDWDYPFYMPIKHFYKKITQIIIEDMKFQLIRNKDTGAIYLIDSDQKRHHIKAPIIFTKYFGTDAWQKQDWIDLEAEKVDAYQDGAPFVDGASIVDVLKQFIATFGKAK